MDCSAIDCTPEDVLEEVSLSRKGDIYALKALCSQKKQGPGQFRERKQKAQIG